MSTRQKLRKAKKLAEKEEAIRLWKEKKALYKVSFPWKQVGRLAVALMVSALIGFGGYKGIIWMMDANSKIISGPFGELDKTVLQETKSATLVTNQGDITFELLADSAPNTVVNFILLAQKDFYDGVKFHRVIDDFMIQTGDPLSKDDNPNNDGTGGPGYTFNDEFNSKTPLLVKGMVAMANSGINTNGSQFFIVTAEATDWLDGAHTPFGRVISGMDVVNAIGTTETNEDDAPIKDIIIEDVILNNEI